MSILTSYCTSLGDVDNVGATITRIWVAVLKEAEVGPMLAAATKV